MSSDCKVIADALKPAQLIQIILCPELGRATVVAEESQIPLAAGDRGQNVRLAARLTGLDIDILAHAEFQAGMDCLRSTLLAGLVPEPVIENLLTLGLVNVADVAELGTAPLFKAGLDDKIAQEVLKLCANEAKSDF